MRRTLTLAVWILVAGACAAPPATSPPALPALDVESVLASYQGWTLLTPEPRNVSIALWALCRATTPEEDAFLASQHGSRYLRLFVNETGAQAMAAEGERLFPPGSIIVKEKLIEPDDASPEAIGIMIKHDSGFNPEGGDWEYAYWEKSGALVRDAEQPAGCQSCHTGQPLPPDQQTEAGSMWGWGWSQARDSVFWAQPEPGGE
jgi:hypothetical protein